MAETIKHYYIWCPKEIVKTKEGYIDSSIGPNKDINVCLHQNCTCTELTNKIIEISASAAVVREQNDLVRRRRSESQPIMQEQIEEVKPIRRRRLQIIEEAISIKRRRIEISSVDKIRRRRIE